MGNQNWCQNVTFATRNDYWMLLNVTLTSGSTVSYYWMLLSNLVQYGTVAMNVSIGVNTHMIHRTDSVSLAGTASLCPPHSSLSSAPVPTLSLPQPQPVRMVSTFLQVVRCDFSPLHCCRDESFYQLRWCCRLRLCRRRQRQRQRQRRPPRWWKCRCEWHCRYW